MAGSWTETDGLNNRPLILPVRRCSVHVTDCVQCLSNFLLVQRTQLGLNGMFTVASLLVITWITALILRAKNENEKKKTPPSTHTQFNTWHFCRHYFVIIKRSFGKQIPVKDVRIWRAGKSFYFIRHTNTRMRTGACIRREYSPVFYLYEIVFIQYDLFISVLYYIVFFIFNSVCEAIFVFFLDQLHDYWQIGRKKGIRELFLLFYQRGYYVYRNFMRSPLLQQFVKE